MSNQTPSYYRQEGDWIDYTPNAAVSAGDTIKIGNAILIAKEDIPANTLGQLGRVGVFRVPKDASTFSAFDAVYWNATGNPIGGTAGSGCYTSTSAGNTLAGRAAAAQLTGDATVDLILNGAVP